MFSYVSRLMHLFGQKPVQTLLGAGLLVLVASILLVSFVRWLRRRRQESPESWLGLLVGSLGTVLKVLIGLAVVVGLAVHLRFLSEEFGRQRGGVTQRNYEAVMTIWGRPHQQGELGVRLVYYTTHYYDKDGLEFDADKLKAATQPIAFRKAEIEHLVPGDPVTQADHDIVIRMNYRKKGSGEYPGFETDCVFSYLVRNFGDRPAAARFQFPLPSQQGLVDNFTITVDGKPGAKELVVNGQSAAWKLDLAPQEQHTLAVSYHSRGLDYVRFEPGAGRSLGKYRVRMTCKGVPQSALNYPIGCMTPTETAEQDGDTILSWKLDNAVTRLGMGVILPGKRQEGYYVGRLLAAAPWGLVLLLSAVLVTYAVTGRSVAWLPLLLTAVGYHLYYLLMAHIADYPPGLAGGMAIAGAVLTALVAAVQLAWKDRLPAWATIVAFLVFCIVYPLMRISPQEGLLLSALYVAMLAYVAALAVRQRLRSA